MINKLFGAKIKIVSGYRGGNDIYLAMQRGEVHGAMRKPHLVTAINQADVADAEQGLHKQADRHLVKLKSSECDRSGGVDCQRALNRDP